jgi:1-acyl-sn-glycerol-3-phosphate acyltransferase
MRERANPLYRLPGETCWLLGEHLLRLKIGGKENLTSPQEHLKEGSLLVYFNHLSFVNPALVLKVVLENFDLPPSRPPAIFTSQKHLDPERKIIYRVQTLIMKGAATAKGFELLPIVQEYDRSSYQDYAAINFASIRKALRILSSPRGVVLIAPEETRSKTGTLQEAKKGIEAIFKSKKVQENTLALPIGVFGTEKIHQTGKFWFNPFAQITLIVGKPLSYEEVKNDAETLELPIKDVFMLKLAQILPENYWGFYSQYKNL